MNPIEALVESSHERWRRGAADFAKLLHPKMELKRPRKTIIRSAIYGNMSFEPDEMRFIESFYLQRLRHVSQMGLLYLVYPDARHSRFEHSLGVLHSLKSLLEADPQVKAALTAVERRTLYFAALLHDCGHGPFSHTTESLLALSGLSLQFRRVGEGEQAGVKPHERRCRDMIHDSDFHLSNIGIESYALKAALGEFGVDPSMVSSIILGSKSTPLLNLLSGDFDVDKMDYFRRDAFFTGTMGGGVDMEAIQRWVRIFDRDGYRLAAYDSRLVGHLLHMMYSRAHVYNVTAYHPVARIAAALILISGDLALRALPPELTALVFSNIELFDDREFLAVLELAASDSADAEEGRILRRTIQRLYLRRLPKRLATLSRGEFVRKFEKCIPVLEAVTGKLPELVYCRISQIAGGKYRHMLSGDHDVDDIAVLELTPSEGAANSWSDDIEEGKAQLGRIYIAKREGGEPVPLTDWLDNNAGPGAADAQARALRAYKLSIWKALVLVPASLKFELEARSLSDAFQQDFAEALSNRELARPLEHTQVQWLPAQRIIGDRVKGWRDDLAGRASS